MLLLLLLLLTSFRSGITCEDYPRVPHAGFAVPAPYVGETINYQCVPGHVQFGAITVSCQENGHWQRPGFCKSKFAPNLVSC